ncbi:hypothetical protein D1871_17885 [Nakamurella silvestris]|nr:hypothetical protein D1871_17885 [Nakamurella silvestris]
MVLGQTWPAAPASQADSTPRTHKLLAGDVVYNASDGWTREASDLISPIMDKIGKAGLKDPAGGFADISINYLTNTGLVYWHGELSREAKRLVAEAAAEGVDIEQVETDYGVRALTDASMAVGDAADRAHLMDLTSIGPNFGYSGLAVGIRDLTPDRAARICSRT